MLRYINARIGADKKMTKYFSGACRYRLYRLVEVFVLVHLALLEGARKRLYEMSKRRAGMPKDRDNTVSRLYWPRDSDLCLPILFICCEGSLTELLAGERVSEGRTCPVPDLAGKENKSGFPREGRRCGQCCDDGS